MFVCYDIKGIQRFIFSVPRLKCIIGASSQIACFDDKTITTIANRDGTKRIFSGGGRGAIRCSSPAIAEGVKRDLVHEAHELGLDIRIGIDEKFRVAALHADQLYPFVPAPDDMDGRPCAESGLWPVPGSDGTKVHPLIERRIEAGKPTKDTLGNYLFRSDLIGNRIPSEITGQGYIVELLRNVNPEEVGANENEKRVDLHRATAGQNALGKRNRWAVIALDVNDMGQQFDAIEREAAGDEEDYVERLKIVSESIRQVTHQALANALVDVMERWLDDIKPNLEDCCYEERGSKYLFLPFRPLVLGGDDVILLCHSGLAMDFCRKMASEFSELSVRKAKEVQEDQHSGGFNPWPATGGRLSISAGVLFTKVTLPLHTAVPYAQSLLESAKNEFRGSASSGQPTAAAVDWETITDTMVDTPAARRNRELQFFDEEIGARVYLTQRPYLLDLDSGERDPARKARAFQSLLTRQIQLDQFPASFRAELKRALKKAWSERTRFCISMGKGTKKYWELADALAEPFAGSSAGSAWFMHQDERSGRQVRTTNVVDAILLLDEQHRLAKETAGQ